MKRGDSPFSSCTKSKLIASVVAEKNVSKDGKIMKQFYRFFIFIMQRSRFNNTLYFTSP